MCMLTATGMTGSKRSRNFEGGLNNAVFEIGGSSSGTHKHIIPVSRAWRKVTSEKESMKCGDLTPG